MAKLTLADVANLMGNPTSAANTINANNALVETALENTLSRDGTTPNQMEADLDLNNNDLLNIQDTFTENLWINGVLVTPDQLETVPDFIFDRWGLSFWGAVGDGTTDDTIAIANALLSGKRLTGAGKTYAVTGTITLPDNANIWDTTFKQLAPGASLSVITLSASSVSGLELKRVRVDRNGDGTNGGLLDGSPGNNGALNSAFGMSFIQAQGHYEDLEVWGDDSGTGILFRQIGESSRIIRPYVHNMDWARTAAADDQVQGVWFDMCTRVEVWGAKVIDLVGTENGVATFRRTRGIVLGGCDSLRFFGSYSERVEQGFDITGATGGPNFNITLVGCLCKDCYVWGFKYANTARDCITIGCVAEDCGASGFVTSGNTSLTPDVTTNRNVFSNCLAKNTGSNGQTVYPTIAGFLVISDGTEEFSGARTKYWYCTALDEQAVPTMEYGFASSVPNVGWRAVGEGIVSIGHTIAATNGFIFREGIVGTVDETNGGVVGEIIETGSDSNGRWVKFADGTMECTHTIDLSASAISTARGSLFGLAAAVTWTFPDGGFAANPNVFGEYRRNDITVVGGAYTLSPSNTTATLGVWTSASVGAGNAKFLDLLAKGRWYV